MDNRHYEVKAIPTTYNGVTFKSRLEARWAVFFDTLRIEWLYEYEGYQLPSGWYVPDFWLSEFKMWVEIKPNEPTNEERTLAGELSLATERWVALQYGDIQVPDLGRNSIESAEVCMGEFGDSSYVWCVCPNCGKLGFEWCGFGDRICHDKCLKPGEKSMGRRRTGDYPVLVSAYERARRYQFK